MQLQALLRRIPCLSAICLAALLPASAQAPVANPNAGAYPLTVDRGAAAVWQSLQKLHTRASIILIVAHPDDEDGGMLGYEIRDQGADGTLLTLNRGEGGQNVMSDDYWDRLGQVRTQELLGASNAFGAHLFFTRVADFGFSKSLDEAIKIWGHDRVLYDVVRQVRLTRPLVITAVFAGNVSDGHGQHQTSGVMAQEVFNAAADPNVFPDQIKAGLMPWAPLKVYVRVPFARVTAKGIYDYATGEYQPARYKNYTNNTWIEGVPSTTVTIPESKYNPLFGRSYFTLAREGLAEQKSQNGGVALPTVRPVTQAYHLYASRVTPTIPQHEDSFFEGIDTSLAAIANYAPADQQSTWKSRLNQLNATVESASSSFNPLDPAKIAPMLAEGLNQTNKLLSDIAASSLPADAKYNMTHELLIKQKQFNDALGQSLGLMVLASVDPGRSDGGPGILGRDNSGQPTSQAVIPGQKFAVNIHFADQGSEAVEVTSANLVSHAGEGWSMSNGKPATGNLPAGEARDQLVSVTVPQTAELTQPYFSRPTLEQSYYDISKPEDLGLPTTPYPLTAVVSYTYHGASATLEGIVQTIHRYTGPGPLPEPLLVAPAISVTVSPNAGVIPLSNTSLHLQVTVHSSVKGPAKGGVRLQLPPGWHSQPETAPFAIASDGDEEVISFTVTPTAVKPQPYTITAVADYNGQQYNSGFHTTGYPGLRPYPYYTDAAYRTSGVDLKVAPHLKVGYVAGTGDEVAQSLQDIGINVTYLSPQDISSGDLSSYDAIILGIRSYAARPELKTSNNRLLEYVKNGGNIIVQYQAANDYHDVTPYPTSLADTQIVVEEDGEASIAVPNDPVLSWPNKITTADFNNWVEERGHGFMSTWDPHFVAPTEMHDTGQAPQKGGLIYTTYGKGTYTYLAFAFFRELPEGVPGSFRIMANLLSIGKNPALHKPAAAKGAAKKHLRIKGI